MWMLKKYICCLKQLQVQGDDMYITYIKRDYSYMYASSTYAHRCAYVYLLHFKIPFPVHFLTPRTLNT